MFTGDVLRGRQYQEAAREKGAAGEADCSRDGAATTGAAAAWCTGID